MKKERKRRGGSSELLEGLYAFLCILNVCTLVFLCCLDDPYGPPAETVVKSVFTMTILVLVLTSAVSGKTVKTAARIVARIFLVIRYIICLPVLMIKYGKASALRRFKKAIVPAERK